ncbi:MAG: nuclear transport factor 2 family protein [Myxococcales bacterium]|nr:nuclear transport factor 2 family protein [Myxococcales bacterium]
MSNDENTSKDHQEVEQVLRLYFAGARGEPGALARAFYSSCNLQSLDADQKLELVPLERFIEHAEAGLIPPHEATMEDLEVVNDMARAKVMFRFAAHAFTDHLTLLRVRGRWRIVAKVYTKTARPS